MIASQVLSRIAGERLQKRRAARAKSKLAPQHWEDWLYTLFPSSFSPDIGFAPHHIEFWDWIDSIQSGESTHPLINILARGGGKSTSLNYAIVRLGATERRKFAVVVRSTQDKANEAINNIAAIMEKSSIERFYPAMGERKVGKFGNVRGWNAQVLRCGNGFSVLGIGLNVPIRGSLIEDMRPDFIACDDVDNELDTEETIKKKIKIITKSILPSGAPYSVFGFVQNLIHSKSIASKLVEPDGVDFLTNRRIIGPVPAIVDMTTEQVVNEEGRIETIITGGTPTWAGQSIEVCQKQIKEWGIGAFNEEAQHLVTHDKEGALWNRELLKKTRITHHRPLYKILIGVDPAASVGQTGIVAVGFYKVGSTTHGVVLADDSTPYGASPKTWAYQVVATYSKFSGQAASIHIIAEGNQGGAMVEDTIKNVDGGDRVSIKRVHASTGKHTRAQPVSLLFEEGIGHMLGNFPLLENELCSWVPGEDSPNRLDAGVWAFTMEMVKTTHSMVSLGASDFAY